MEVLDKGKHCQEEFCHQLDLLPMKCKACNKSFCASHFKCENHKCTDSAKLDYKIPTCKYCNKTIEFKRNKDLDLCLKEHMQKCFFNQYLSTSISKEVKTESKKCTYKNCKSKEIFRFKCDTCEQNFCTKHRVPEIHKCQPIIKPRHDQFIQPQNYDYNQYHQNYYGTNSQYETSQYNNTQYNNNNQYDYDQYDLMLYTRITYV